MKTKLILFFLLTSFYSFSQNGNNTINKTFQTLTKQDNAAYFEVTREMFKMLSDSKGINPEYKDYISKLHSLQLVQASGENRQELSREFYNTFVQQTNLKGYSRLMTKKEGNGQLSFYKKESNTENEFLLVSTDMIIYITGTLDLKSISEFEQVMEIAGSAFDM